jgi:hypothetical protein
LFRCDARASVLARLTAPGVAALRRLRVKEIRNVWILQVGGCLRFERGELGVGWPAIGRAVKAVEDSWRHSPLLV